MTTPTSKEASPEPDTAAGAGNASSVIEGLLAKVFLACIAFAFTVAALEVASWWMLETRSPVERDYPVKHIRRPEPYVMFGGTPEVRGLNRLGYRGEAPEAPRSEGEYRIVTLGGSTVFRGEPPIPAMLEELAHTAGYAQVRSYNFGVVSSVSGMELARLVSEVVDHRPDLVVLYGGGNDLLHPFDYDPRPGYPFNFMVYEANPTLASDVHEYPRLPLLLYGSHLARYFLGRYFVDSFVPRDALREEVGWNTDSWRREIVEQYWANLTKSKAVAAAFGAETLAVFQPILYFKESLSEPERPFLDAAEAEHGRRARRLLRELVAAKPESERSFFVDASDAFQAETETVFTDAIHIEQDDRRRMAELIFQHVEPLLAAQPGREAPAAEGP